MRRHHRPPASVGLCEHVHEVRVRDTEQRIDACRLEQVEDALVDGHSHCGKLLRQQYISLSKRYPEPDTPSTARPSSSRIAAVSAPSSGAGPATRPGVCENQVGTPGKRTGPCGVSTVSNMPTALRCGSSNSAPGVLSGAAGISSSPNSASHSCVVRCFIVSATNPYTASIWCARCSSVEYNSLAHGGCTAFIKAFQCLSL